jgi:hypothetical protein
VSTAVVSQLRAGRAPIMLAQPGAGVITMRVQVAEMWEAVRVVARPDTGVAEVKQRVVADFFPGHEFPDDFVLKLRGWEMLDESQSLATAGIVDGAIVLLAYRRRRPVR